LVLLLRSRLRRRKLRGHRRPVLRGRGQLGCVVLRLRLPVRLLWLLRLPVGLLRRLLGRLVLLLGLRPPGLPPRLPGDGCRLLVGHPRLTVRRQHDTFMRGRLLLVALSAVRHPDSLAVRNLWNQQFTLPAPHNPR